MAKTVNPWHFAVTFGTSDKHIIRHNKITFPHTTHADQGFLIRPVGRQTVPVFCCFPKLSTNMLFAADAEI